jgi:hypothetical protein
MSSRHLSKNAVAVSAQRNNSNLKSTLLLAAGIFLISLPGLELQDFFGLISDFTLRQDFPSHVQMFHP